MAELDDLLRRTGLDVSSFASKLRELVRLTDTIGVTDEVVPLDLGVPQLTPGTNHWQRSATAWVISSPGEEQSITFSLDTFLPRGSKITGLKLTYAANASYVGTDVQLELVAVDTIGGQSISVHAASSVPAPTASLGTVRLAFSFAPRFLMGDGRETLVRVRYIGARASSEFRVYGLTATYTYHNRPQPYPLTRLLTLGGNMIVPQGQVTSGDIYVQPPVSPNAFDDEFNSGDPDLAARGWSFRNLTTATAMTRVGDVYPYEYAWKGGVGTLGVNEYRSRIQNGRLALQLSTNATNEYALYKAVTLPSATANEGGVVWGRFGSTRGLEAAGTHGFCNVSFWADSGGVPDLANRNYHQIHYSGANSLLSYTGVNGGAATTTTLTLGDTSPDDTFGVMTTASNGTRFFRVDTQSGADSSSPLKTGAGYKASATIAWAGMGFFCNTVAPEREAAGLRFIDFLRLRTGDMHTLCSSSQWLFP